MTLCVYYMTGTPKGSTESGFMENPENEPANPGLQEIDLYPTPNMIPDLELHEIWLTFS